jgi:hypothetical protein
LRITCYYGDYPEMGYIYLKPSAVDKEAIEAENEIAEHMNPEKIRIWQRYG